MHGHTSLILLILSGKEAPLGGVMNPDTDTLGKILGAVNSIKPIFASGKPVAAICHDPWTLIEADVVRGRKMTLSPSLQNNLRNAGPVGRPGGSHRPGLSYEPQTRRPAGLQ
jgi:putative intracellular protease/amidase